MAASDGDESYLACLKDEHPLRQCQAFLNMTITERRKKVKQWKLCNNCLSLQHSIPAVIPVKSVVASTTPCSMTHVMVRATVPTPLFQLKKIRLLWALIPLMPSMARIPDPWEKNQYFLHSRFRLLAREEQLWPDYL